jgi:hypothetical protein
MEYEVIHTSTNLNPKKMKNFNLGDLEKELVPTSYLEKIYSQNIKPVIEAYPDKVNHIVDLLLIATSTRFAQNDDFSFLFSKKIARFKENMEMNYPSRHSEEFDNMMNDFIITLHGIPFINYLVRIEEMKTFFIKLGTILGEHKFEAFLYKKFNLPGFELALIKKDSETDHSLLRKFHYFNIIEDFVLPGEIGNFQLRNAIVDYFSSIGGKVVFESDNSSDLNFDYEIGDASAYCRISRVKSQVVITLY